MTVTTLPRLLPGARFLRQAVDRGASPQPHVVGGPATTSLAGQLGRFAAIGVVSTLAYVVLYGAIRSFTSPVAANAVALLATAIGNTAANRRLTFGVHEPGSLVRDQVGGLVALGAALAITTGAVVALERLAPGVDRSVELAVLLAANGVATLVRFVLLRAWILPDRAPVGLPNAG